MVKKFWLKRSNLPSNPTQRGMVEVTLRWREASGFGMKQLQKTVKANDILEGGKWEQFVPEFLEVYEAPKVEAPKEYDEPKAEETASDAPTGKTTTKNVNKPAKGKK